MSALSGEALSAEDKNMLMAEERSTMKKLFEGAMKDDKAAVESAFRPYITLDESPLAILGQFKDGRERTALHFAAQSHATSVLLYVQSLATSKRELATLKALANAPDSEKLTPLACACMNAAPPSTPASSLSSTVSLLLSFGADPNSTATSGATPLHHACGSGALSFLDQIPLTPALVNSLSDAGTPLHFAAGSVHENASAIIEKLAKAGADPNILDKRSLPPLILSVAGCRDENSSSLIVAGGDVGHILAGGITVAHIAADNGLVATLAALAASEGGKSLFAIRNDVGELPIELAAENEYFSCFKVLSADKTNELELKKQMEAMKKIQEAKSAARASAAPKKEEDSLPPMAEGAEQWTDADEIASVAACEKVLEASKSVDAAAKLESVEAKKRGNTLFGKKDYKAAIEAYSQAVELFAGDHTYYSNRCACYMALNDFKAALHDAVCCRIIAPSWQKGAYRLASARLALKRFEDAAVAAWEGVSINPAGKESDELKDMMKRCVREGKNKAKKN